jgi:hypothetical protein
MNSRKLNNYSKWIETSSTHVFASHEQKREQFSTAAISEHPF